MTTVWIYVDISKQVGDLDHLKVFIDEATANTWLAENDWHSSTRCWNERPGHRSRRAQ
jgi:hypothetical protein